MDEVMDEVSEGIKGGEKLESETVKLNGDMNGACDESMEVSETFSKSPLGDDRGVEEQLTGEESQPEDGDDAAEDTAETAVEGPAGDVDEDADDAASAVPNNNDELDGEDVEMEVDSDGREVPNKECDTSSSEVPHTSNEKSEDNLEESLNNGPSAQSSSNVNSEVEDGKRNESGGKDGDEEDVEDENQEDEVNQDGDNMSDHSGDVSDSKVENDVSETKDSSEQKVGNSESGDKSESEDARTLQNGGAATPDGSEDPQTSDRADKTPEETTPDKSEGSENKEEETPEGDDTTPTKKGKGKKKPDPGAAVNLTPRRSSRNLNKQKSYVEDKDEVAERDDGSDIEEITMVDPLAVSSDLTRENKENSKALKSRVPGPNKTIVVNDTKHLVEIASGSKSVKGVKKEPTLVIIDTNSILSGRGPIPAPQQHSLHKTPQRSQLQITPAHPIHSTTITQSYSVLPVTQQPSHSSSLPSTPRLPTSSTITPVKPPIILPSLTDDMYVVEAPSFIVPYVYEKPPVKSLKDFIDVLQVNIKAAKEAERIRKEEVAKKAKEAKNEQPKDKEAKDDVSKEKESGKEGDDEKEKKDADEKESAVDQKEGSAVDTKEKEATVKEGDQDEVDKKGEEASDKEKASKEISEDEKMEVEEKKTEKEDAGKVDSKDDSKKDVEDKEKSDQDEADKKEKDGEKEETDKKDGKKAETAEEEDSKAEKPTKDSKEEKEEGSKDKKESAEADHKEEERPKDLKVHPGEKDEGKSEPEVKDLTKGEETKKPASYFENPLGKFFIQIGINLVQEHVQTDLLRSQRKKRDREGGKGGVTTQMAISSLEQTLEFSKENNEPFHLKQKKCDFCNFKTESALVMAHHMETPHMRNYVYRCNFCPMEVRSPHDILFHMEAEHNVRGRLERGPAFHQCPSCSFEDNQKGKLTRHLVSCQKRYRPEKNQDPPLDWEPPAKIPRVSRNRPGFPMGGGAAVSGLPGVTKTPPMMGQPHPLLPKLAAGATLMGQTTLGPVGTIGRGRGRPPMQGRFVPDMKQAQVIQQQVPRPMSAQTLRQGMLYRSSPTGPQSQVLLPTSYHIGNQLYQNAAGKVQSKVQQQPSISITPLPRQPAVTPPNAHGASLTTGIKPGHPSGGKATFVICEICDGYIKDLEQLRSHMQWIHKVKIHPKMIFNRPPLNCQKCQFRFFTDQGLERHLLGSHGLVTSSMQEAANKGKDGGRCPVCGRVYQWKLLNHVARDHSMTLKPAHLSYKCTVCTATFGMYKQFENHVYTAHSVVAKRVMEKKPGSGSGSGGAGSGGGGGGGSSSQGGGGGGAGRAAGAARPATSSPQGESLLKPLKINDEITIIPQPARARPGSTGRPSPAPAPAPAHAQNKQ